MPFPSRYHRHQTDRSHKVLEEPLIQRSQGQHGSPNHDLPNSGTKSDRNQQNPHHGNGHHIGEKTEPGQLIEIVRNKRKGHHGDHSAHDHRVSPPSSAGSQERRLVRQRHQFSFGRPREPPSTSLVAQTTPIHIPAW